MPAYNPIFTEEELQQEIWKPVVGLEQAYQVSNLGRICTIDRIDTRKAHRKSQIMAITKAENGYLRISLTFCGKSRYKPVHRLVLESFTGPRPSKFETNHKDGNKTNNRIENLEWISHRDNLRHAVDTGLKTRVSGIAKQDMKLDEEMVRVIHKLLSKGANPVDIAFAFMVNRNSIYGIQKGESWRHLHPSLSST
jgi:HNH endonuclease/NUMOD4 motif